MQSPCKSNETCFIWLRNLHFSVSENPITPILCYVNHQYGARMSVFQEEVQTSDYSMASRIIMPDHMPIEVQYSIVVKTWVQTVYLPLLSTLTTH